MDNETEKLYGYTVVENRTKVTLIKENRALMSFDKRLFREDPLASWRLARVLQEVSNRVRGKEDKNGD